jgi:iron complex outermembrane receptor protein
VHSKFNLRKGALLALALPLVVAFPQQSFAQDDELLEEIVTTGTRRAARSAADTPAPIDVVSADELRNQGDTDMSNLLRTSVPSYNVNTQPISDAATLVRPANLRGLAPDSTLVLVNGKRRHRAAVISFLGGGISDGSQGPDISVIPTIALKQVEILRDGAASQYGSDAIAGVVNFILRDSQDGASLEAQWGETYEGDGAQYKIAGNVGFPLGDDGFLNISGQYAEVDATSRSTQRDDAAGLIAGGNTEVANPAQIWGQPNVNEDLTIFVNAAIPLSDQVELYGFGNYAERQVEGGFFFRNPTNRGAVYSNDEGATLLVGDLTPSDGVDNCAPYRDRDPNDTALLDALDAEPDCYAFTELTRGGFTPRFGGDLEDSSLVAGLRGELAFGNGLMYDVSYTYGKNEAAFFINNTINASLGPNTPRSFTPGTYIQTDNNFNLDFSYGIPVASFASDLNLAFGYEHRDEEFEIIAGDPQSFEIGPLSAPSADYPGGQGFSSSSNGFGGFTPSSAGTDSETNDAFYVDAEADVTDRFVLQAAVRFEDFDSFGDTTNYKLGGLFSVNDNVKLRGTFSTGFHAPTAGQANVTNVTTQFSGSFLVDQGTIPLSSTAGQFVADFVEAETGVRPTLGPEESDNFTIGTAFSIGNFDFTIDYFNIAVDDRISISDQADFIGILEQTAEDNGIPLTGDETTSQLLNLLDGAGVIDSSAFAGAEDLTSFGYFNNAFDTETQGIDLVVNTDFEMIQGGDTTVAVAFNWTDTEVTRGTLVDGTGSLSFTRQRQLEENVPSVRGSITLNHNQGPWRGLARLNYFGSFFECHLDAVGDDAGTCDLPIDGDAEVTIDLEGAYNFNDTWEVVLGARNAFDSFPDNHAWAGIAGATYPPTAPNGFTGGSYYLKVKAEF